MSTKNFPHISKDKRTVSAPKHDVFHAIADPTRRQMLQLLADNELSIAAIAKSFPISRTAVNKHLRVLSEAGLVSCRKTGRETRYRLEPEPLAELKTWLSFFEPYWDERLAALKHLVEADEESS
ncbi:MULTISPECIES: ArsR/SmtB family transcription factor [Geobacillus]|uniref:ArsR/SmtB family transcription factor n=1 Tax=Geobacillus TaxID=129337 RepID=UPI0002AF4159|nr:MULTISPECIES: metalloregulator ArsR/SmtB family transcription factor [Geobacillus]AGE20939.1 transcriptional regulator ArsR family [Geobacillus sp. GHH01]OQP16242.1 transcriptional regulator [Geobacillus zalihae]QNU23943.1 winged helix-turn-helix transcriptional regulator [Geobacillus zalihae]